jgi:hypothetical protein
MFVSELAQVRRQETFNEILVLPYFVDNKQIKGSQFIFQEEDSLVVLLLDQEINNLYQNQSKTI